MVLSVTEPEPVGELHVERDGASVLMRIEEEDGQESYHLPPERAAQVAMWLNQAAAEAKQWQRKEASR